MNQVRQIGLAILNHESAARKFPSGGIEPWPAIENYAEGGRANSAEKQGLSWAFQILPFLEEDAVHDIATTQEIENTPISGYFCPSRRPPTQSNGSTSQFSTQPAWLMDYAALAPAPSRAEMLRTFNDNQSFVDDMIAGRACKSIPIGFWGVRTYSNDFNPVPKAQLGAGYVGFNGIIVRSSYHVSRDSGAVTNLNYDRIVTTGKVRDGLSKTGLVTEKRIPRVPLMLPPPVPTQTTMIAAGRTVGTWIHSCIAFVHRQPIPANCHRKPAVVSEVHPAR